MTVSETLLIPWGYSTQYMTIGQARSNLLVHYHPEYVARLCAWLIYKNGTVGIGGTFRADGTQPGLPGFAPEGRSFHQNQQYADGFIGATAVDLVVPDGPDAGNHHDGIRWSQVPAQGSTEALIWGVHCNVGAPPSGEPWHIQPVEIDGWLTWQRNGSPAPTPGYPYPGRNEPERGDDMRVIKMRGQAGAFLQSTVKTHLDDAETRDRLIAKYGPMEELSEGEFRAAGPVIGEIPAGYDTDGVR